MNRELQRQVGDVEDLELSLRRLVTLTAQEADQCAALQTKAEQLGTEYVVLLKLGCSFTETWLYVSETWLYVTVTWLYVSETWLYVTETWLYVTETWLYVIETWLYVTETWL